MKKKKGKKGVELSINTIIVAVIVVVVLVVVVSFFLGGFTGLSDRVKATFFGVTAGFDRTLAVQTCRQYCDNAKLLPAISVKSSSYCTSYLNVDENNDGEADFTGTGDDKKYTRYYCYDNSDKESGSKDLEVDCPIRSGDVILQLSKSCK